mmetsp:Transcript_14288/g.19100  ORF Transcript_14288/g.19100 Transcript_14288/m.19100 type:complete len:507 (-) Transcript_14288:83-1603(-)|eukprot:CAMPEP_0197289044 /NCGR_PEP_ID=MMETSP0890-20130614/6250_1 /TAXON_ID=44058 ORGANISM="Aureoumbra lagunensis, Strain CCMP1510" /NCGR_SAMPLE_ID=MMETSP0890 /ASSEMBLY_ACC=CAM_ASM_000533 /LENGTH=506 /DNA_ID=CAMNT_0042760193 /DNA_START=153 /DNA_END=1673 /DNA_ORIENTATION=-
MDYPRNASCSYCTTQIVIDCLELEAFVSCPSCGARSCEVCKKWFKDEVELFLHTHDEVSNNDDIIGSTESIDEAEDDEGLWTFWEKRPQLEREIEVAWEKQDSKGDYLLVFEACTVLSREGRGSFRVEYQAEEDEAFRCWIHGLGFNELSALERLDALEDDIDQKIAMEIPWARNTTTGEVSPDIISCTGELRRWRYLQKGTEDNGNLYFKDKSGAERCSSTLISGNNITTESPEKKRRLWRSENLPEAYAAANVAALKHGGPSVDRYVLLFQLLESLELPPVERRNVLRKDTKIPPRGVNVGLTNIHFKDQVSLSQTVQLPEYHLLTQALTAFFHCEAPDDANEFCFTSIQLNRGDNGFDGAALHTDRNNLGFSYIIGIGPYQGGQLWTRDHGIVETRRVWTRFNGRRYHATLPYTGGPRYTLVYWCHANYEQLALRQRQHLERLGFCFPSFVQEYSSLLQHESLPHDSKQHAREAFRLACQEVNMKNNGGDSSFISIPQEWADG